MKRCSFVVTALVAVGVATVGGAAGIRALPSGVAGIRALPNGAAENAYVGASGGDWHVATNWSLGHVPTADDAVALNGCSVVATNGVTAKSLTLDGATLTLGDAAARKPVSLTVGGDFAMTGASRLYVYAGRLADVSVFSSAATRDAALWKAANVVKVGGRFSVEGTSVVYPDADEITGVPVLFKVCDFTLGEEASFNATARGWGWSPDAWTSAPAHAKRRRKESQATDDFWTFAPGSGLNYNIGGNYGYTSKGTTWEGGVFAASYGTMYAPFLPGSPSGNYYATAANPSLGRGPGSIVILASGSAQVDGRLIADADDVPNTQGDGGRPSGGGIWLAMRDGAFGAKARLSAKGGSPISGGQFGPGNGGRIAAAIGLTAAQIEALATGGDGAAVIRALPNAFPFAEASVAGGVNVNKPTWQGSAGTLATLMAENLTYVTVGGNPIRADGVTPAVGVHTVTNGTTVRFTAGTYGCDIDREGVRYACRGCVVSNALGQVIASSGTKIDVAMTKGPLSVTWLWTDRAWNVQVAKPAHGVLTLDGAVQAGDVSVWTPGATPSIAVVPDAGWSFLRWEGNVPPEKGMANPLVFTATNPVSATPILVPATKPGDATLVAALSGTSATFAPAVAVSGSPLALGIACENPSSDAVVTITLIDKNGVTFTSSIPLTGTFTLWPLDPAYWTSQTPTYPLAVTSVAVTRGTATLKSLRAAYDAPLGRAARHFASNESREQQLGGTIATNGETVAISPSGIRFALHASTGTKFEIVWDTGFVSRFAFMTRDQTEALLADFAGMKKGTPFTIPDARVCLENNIGQFVRPDLRHYRTNASMTEIGFDYLADCERLPGAKEHINDFSLRHNPDGTVTLWWDGSQCYTFTPLKETPNARVASVRMVFGAGAEYALKPTVEGYDANRYEVLDLAANPRAKAFKQAKIKKVGGESRSTAEPFIYNGAPVKVVEPIDSGDVAICHYAQGVWAMEVDEYTGRDPFAGFGGAIHFRVPPRDYVRVHLVVALDPDEAKDRILNVRLAYYYLNGAGTPLIADTTLDWTAGVPADAVQVGSVVRDDATVPLYAVTIPLAAQKLVPEAARYGYLDFEFLGAKSGSKPDPKRDSAFNIFGATLEAAPMTLDVVPADGAPGNVFTQDENDRFLTLRLRGERTDSRATLAWQARDRAGNPVFSGSRDAGPAGIGVNVDTRVDLASVADPGLYTLAITVTGDGGASAYDYTTRFAILPPSGRQVATDASPYATWWFWAHGSPADWSIGGPILQKAGIRKSCHGDWPADKMAQYGVTFTGNCNAPSQSAYFDASNKCFKPQGNLSGEQWFVTNVAQQIAAKPRVDHILIWHESAPSGGIPEEILGLPIPAATDSDRAAGAYVNEVGRLVRKYFPDLRIQIGNTSASLGAASRPFRGGADPQYYDSVGIETPSQAMMPERLLVWGLQGMMMTKESASYYAKRPVPAAGCHEYVYRTDAALGETLQAAWYMRDVLISLANRMPVISPAVTFDVRNSYYDTLWGQSGMLFRAPFCEPKLSYVAYAALTKALDGVTFLGELATGSTTVYALHFKRIDGQYATALWCARGEADVALAVSGGGTVMAMCGKTSALGATVAASEEPAYVITANPVTSAKIVGRRFRQSEAASARARTIWKMTDASDVVVAPDTRITSRGHACLPMMTPSTNFNVRSVVDASRGRCLEVALDTSVEAVNRYYTEYTTLRPIEAPVVPADAKAIGVWVKGNSSWGQIRFEITDADGDVFVNYEHPTDWDTLDWQGLLCVNFDGWAYIWCRMPNDSGLKYDAKTGLSNAPWSREVTKGNGKYDGPGRLTAITVGMNREKLDLIDFKPTDTTIRLGEVRVESAASASETLLIVR